MSVDDVHSPTRITEQLSKDIETLSLEEKNRVECTLAEAKKKKPLVVVVIGMAGSGKTTVMKSLWRHFNQHRIVQCQDASGQIKMEKREPFKTYIVNLDPAVLSTPYPVNIDICDTVKYKQVMKQYNLGPNGAIMTSLNLFATKFDQVHDVLLKRASHLDIILIDTPGQIEVFNWSASGSIILDTLALSFPTVILFILDTARSQSPITFMSNMMYSCGVMYKSKLPFILAFNKIDVQSPKQCLDWIKNYETFADDVNREETYMATLSRSCALAMNEFYQGIHTVSISAATSLGFDELEIALQKAADEYTKDYVPWLQEQRKAVIQKRQRLAKESSERFARDREKDATQDFQQHIDEFPGVLSSMLFYWIWTLWCLSVMCEEQQNKSSSHFLYGEQANTERMNLYMANWFFKHKPHLSYSLPTDETFQELPRIIQIRLQRLFCQDIILPYIQCVLYLEVLFSQFTLSLEAEALLSASLVFRSILLELQSEELIAFHKQEGYAYLTIKALGYVEEIRQQLSALKNTETYLTRSFCFHITTCREENLEENLS